MAELTPLSGNLSTFKDVYDGSFPSMKSKQGEISTSLNDAIQSLDSAINGFQAAGSDSQIASLKECIILAKSGLERVKSHVDGDLSALFNNGDELRGDDSSGEETIGAIVKLINDGKDWEPSILEKIWNATIGSFKEEWRMNDQAKIDEANSKISHLNSKGESQLNAMASAMNAVSFGVAGNMVNGGSLGASVTYSDNYNFNPEQWELENPVVHLSMLQQAGCAVVGAVEGVAKVAEGIADFGLTAAAGVVSVLSENAGQKLADIAAEDWSAKAAAGLMDLTSGITGITAEAYQQSGGRKLGKGTGELIGHGALWLTGGGAILSAVSIAGDSTEGSLQQGKGAWSSLAQGTVVGVASYALGKAGQGIASRFIGWANGTGSSTIVGKAFNAVANAVATPFSQASGVGGKLVSIATSPLRFVGRAMQGGANAINKTVGNNKLFQKLTRTDAAVSGVFNRAFGGTPTTASNAQTNNAKTATNNAKTATNNAQTPTNNGGGASNPTNANATSATPADGTLGSNVDANTLSNGSMTADGRYHPPASQNGAPTGAADSAFNNMPGSDGDLAINVDANTLTTGGSMTADGVYHQPAALNGAPSGPADSVFNNLPADGTSAFNVDSSMLSAGSMTADGSYHLPARLNGAPTGATDSAFNMM